MKIVEIAGVNYINYGATMMMEACKIQLLSRGFGAAVSWGVGGFRKRSNDGLLHLIKAPESYPSVWSKLADNQVASVPRKLKERLKIVGNHDICAVFDASGFKYSDQWGLDRIQRGAARAELCQARGQKYILLPQAFGPFKTAQSCRAVRRLVAGANLVCARDRESYKYLVEACGHHEHMRVYPDFTNGLDAHAYTPVCLPPKSLVIVPNMRMVDMNTGHTAEKYVPMLVLLIKQFAERGFNPIIMVHEAQDTAIAATVARESKIRENVIDGVGALVLKNTLKCARVVIASRFHALVSALSQGVPSLGLGWSHKYMELFRDYDCEELMLDISDRREKVDAAIGAVVNVDDCDGLERKLRRAGESLRIKTNAMWEEVFSLI